MWRLDVVNLQNKIVDIVLGSPIYSYRGGTIVHSDKPIIDGITTSFVYDGNKVLSGIKY